MLHSILLAGSLDSGCVPYGLRLLGNDRAPPHSGAAAAPRPAHTNDANAEAQANQTRWQVTIDAPIGRHAQQRELMCVKQHGDKTGKPSKTICRVRER